jgi:hypothetical protein
MKNPVRVILQNYGYLHLPRGYDERVLNDNQSESWSMDMSWGIPWAKKRSWSWAGMVQMSEFEDEVVMSE